jgi:hypothetical protein
MPDTSRNLFVLLFGQISILMVKSSVKTSDRDNPQI